MPSLKCGRARSTCPIFPSGRWTSCERHEENPCRASWPTRLGPMSDEREILTWELFGVASRELATMVADDGYDPSMILSIARGGLLIGGAMGYALAVKNTYTMNVEFYTGVDER